jgi:transposase-like protein
MTTSLRIPAASEEFAGADFGDERLSRRLVRIADAAAASPSAGFPTMTQSDGELEGVYRFWA